MAPWMIRVDSRREGGGSGKMGGSREAGLGAEKGRQKQAGMGRWQGEGCGDITLGQGWQMVASVVSPWVGRGWPVGEGKRTRTGLGRSWGWLAGAAGAPTFAPSPPGNFRRKVRKRGARRRRRPLRGVGLDSDVQGGQARAHTLPLARTPPRPRRQIRPGGGPGSGPGTPLALRADCLIRARRLR